MKKTTIAALASAIALTFTASSPAMAGSSEGKFQVKLLGTGVLPDGKIAEVKAINTGTQLGAAVAAATNPQTAANDNYVPTLAIEYFVTPMFSVETICCLTQHHVNGAGGLAGTRLVDHVLVLPATVTAKAHLDLGVAKPYIGAGPSLFAVFGEKPGATASALGVTRVKMSNDVGFALQAGVDVPINDKGMGLNIDAKRYFQDLTATFYAGETEALRTKHSLDPWVVSAGLTYRF